MPSGGFASLCELLDAHAAARGAEPAFLFIDDHGVERQRLSFAGLQRRSRGLARRLAAGCAPGERVLLAFPPGLDFIVGFFACLQARLVAVPVMPARRQRLRDAVAAIVRDCRPVAGLAVGQGLEALRDSIAALEGGTGRWLAADAPDDDTPPHGDLPGAGRGSLAFLQYTSGSTSSPKGVMVSHGNLLDNLEMIRRRFGTDPTSTCVSWVPLYHDMGLILNVLQAFHVGALCVLMAPVSFIQRPLSWLRAIHRHRARVAGAPNFAFDLCVDRYDPQVAEGLDLSSLRITFNGAEPVRAESLRRFAKAYAPHGLDAKTLYPCYGMAEATLLISGGTPGRGAVLLAADAHALQQGSVRPAAEGAAAKELVGCGRVLDGEALAVVDPSTGRRAQASQVGEIWVRGRHVAGGYWGRAEASRETFEAQIEAEPGPGWLRTGDLGWIDADGEVYVTGRLKDLLIIRGVNHYPQDIERTTERSHPALRAHCNAAFGVLRDGVEALVVVQEVERSFRHELDVDEVLGAIRAALVQDHELSAFDIVLIRTGTILKTTSGKIRRAATREQWLRGELQRAEAQPALSLGVE